jgi:hypothetical protein
MILISTFIADRLACAAENRGWIDWRHRRGSASLAGAMLEPRQTLTQPSYSNITQAREKGRLTRFRHTNDEPPAPGTAPA